MSGVARDAERVGRRPEPRHRARELAGLRVALADITEADHLGQGVADLATAGKLLYLGAPEGRLGL